MKRATGLIAFALMLFAVVSESPRPAIGADGGVAATHKHTAQTQPPAPAQAPAKPTVSKKSPAAEYTPTVRYRLRTELAEGKMAFVGVGGAIEGLVNPTLRVNEGDVVQVSLVNNDGIEHDVVFPEFKAGSDRVNRQGASSVTVFRAAQAVEFRNAAPAARSVLVNGAAGAVVLRDGRPYSVIAFTVSGGRIREMDILADPVRLAGLDLSFVDGR